MGLCQWRRFTSNGYIELNCCQSCVNIVGATCWQLIFHDDITNSTITYEMDGSIIACSWGETYTFNYVSGGGACGAHPASVTLTGDTVSQIQCPCCPCVYLPHTLTATISHTCATLNFGTITLTQDLTDGSWSYIPGMVKRVRVFCRATDDWEMDLYCPNGNSVGSGVSSSFTCNPLSITFPSLTMNTPPPPLDCCVVTDTGSATVTQ
jgi:hypothetical protein